MLGSKKALQRKKQGRMGRKAGGAILEAGPLRRFRRGGREDSLAALASQQGLFEVTGTGRGQLWKRE